MLAILVASDAPLPPRTWPARLISGAVHAGLIAMTVAGSQSPPPPPSTMLRDTTIYLPVILAPRPLTAGLPRIPGLPGLLLPAVLDLPSSVPLPSVPPPGLIATVWSDPFPGAPGVPGDSTRGVPGIPSQVLDARVVEQQPTILAHPAPRYPEVLRQAGIEGQVLVEAVLDTLGRVEPGSLRVTRGAHPLLDAEALVVVRGSQYRPGRMGARAVRVRIQVPVGFALRR